MWISENSLKDFKNLGEFCIALYFVKDVWFTVTATILIIYPHFFHCPYLAVLENSLGFPLDLGNMWWEYLRIWFKPRREKDILLMGSFSKKWLQTSTLFTMIFIYHVLLNVLVLPNNLLDWPKNHTKYVEWDCEYSVKKLEKMHINFGFY